jgi:hypothetical protein
LLQSVDNLCYIGINLVSKVFCDSHQTRLDIFGLVLDLIDLPFKQIHVIVVNGGEAVPLQTVDVIGSAKGLGLSL